MLRKVSGLRGTQYNGPIQVVQERLRRLRVYCLWQRMPSSEVLTIRTKITGTACYNLV